MTLRRKALIVVGTTIVGLFLILSVLTRTVLLDNYKQLEAKSVRRNTARVVEAFGAELSYLENSVNDWAAWDETYTFIQEEDDAYIQSNLMDQTFENLRINLMIFIDDMGRVIFSKAFDFGIGQEIPVPIGIYEKISPDSVLLNSPDIQSGYTGFLLLDKKIVLIAAYPIITSKQEGPIQGTLIFGRFLDQDEVERLIKITHLSFTVGPIADTDLPSEIGSIAAFAEENTMLVQPASQETVVGYTLLNDVFEKPALILKVELPREIYQQGLYTLSYLLVLLVVIGIIFGLLTLLLLEKGILSRVSYLNQNVRIYGQNGNLSARLFLQGNDELSSIGAEINKMLEALEMSENALRDGERRNLLRAIPDQLFVFSRDGRCLDHKAGDESFPGRHAQSYVGKSINDFGLSIEAHQMAMYSIQQALDFKSVHAFEFELHQDEHLQYEARFAALNENEVLVIARDMTERVKAQKDLDKSERLYRSLFEDASTANFLINLENIYVAVNQEAADLLDYTREELIGKAISDIVDPSEYPATLNVKQKLLSGECVPPYERSFQKKDGTKIPVEIHPTLIKDSDGQPIYIQSLVRDITERKQMEEELRNAALFPSEDPNPVMRVSADGRLLYANSSSKILLDYWDYDSKRGLPQDLLKAAADTLAKGSTINHDVDYEEKTFSFVIAPITDHGYVNLYGQEITERKRKEKQIRSQMKRLSVIRHFEEAITSSLDLRIILNILLSQIIEHFDVDAVDILLLNSHTKILEITSRLGFHTGALQYTQLHLGESYAGKAALERCVVHISDLAETPGGLSQSKLLADEGFHTYSAVPLIAKGQVKGILEIFHRKVLGYDLDWEEFLVSLAAQAAIAIDNAQLFQDAQRSNLELGLAYDATLEGWAKALELRDKKTEGHSQRVTKMTVRLGQAVGMKDEELVHLRRGALLHDIGKMGIPDSILLKPGPLTEEEWEIMRKHPVYAFEMISSIPYLHPALDIPYSHHEKWDGTGYPQGLKGEKIPLAARVFALVDVWDALSSDRPYRPRWSEEKIREYIRSLSAIHFDPALVDAFFNQIDSF